MRPRLDVLAGPKRGRPALAWPVRHGCPDHRSNKLTTVLLRHCRGCTACWVFHSMRFDRARWAAADGGKSFYTGQPCRTCKQPYRRPYDGACYPCHLDRNSLDKERWNRLVDDSGRFRLSWGGHLAALKRRRLADTRIGNAEFERGGWRAAGTVFGDGRLHVVITDVDAHPTPWGRVIDDPGFGRRDSESVREASLRIAKQVNFYGPALGQLLEALNERYTEFARRA